MGVFGDGRNRGEMPELPDRVVGVPGRNGPASCPCLFSLEPEISAESSPWRPSKADPSPAVRVELARSDEEHCVYRDSKGSSWVEAEGGSGVDFKPLCLDRMKSLGRLLFFLSDFPAVEGVLSPVGAGWSMVAMLERPSPPKRFLCCSRLETDFVPPEGPALETV
jgi:hypothetical protein